MYRELSHHFVLNPVNSREKSECPGKFCTSSCRHKVGFREIFLSKCRTRKRTLNSYRIKTIRDIRKIIADSKSRHSIESNFKMKFFHLRDPLIDWHLYCSKTCLQRLLHSFSLQMWWWWCGGVVKAQCFKSCGVYLRGFESPSSEPQTTSQQPTQRSILPRSVNEYSEVTLR